MLSKSLICKNIKEDVLHQQIGCQPVKKHLRTDFDASILGLVVVFEQETVL
jgi:hypothetical protein